MAIVTSAAVRTCPSSAVRRYTYTPIADTSMPVNLHAGYSNNVSPGPDNCSHQNVSDEGGGLPSSTTVPPRTPVVPPAIV